MCGTTLWYTEPQTRCSGQYLAQAGEISHPIHPCTPVNIIYIYVYVYMSLLHYELHYLYIHIIIIYINRIYLSDYIHMWYIMLYYYIISYYFTLIYIYISNLYPYGYILLYYSTISHITYLYSHHTRVHVHLPTNIHRVCQPRCTPQAEFAARPWSVSIPPW